MKTKNKQQLNSWAGITLGLEVLLILVLGGGIWWGYSQVQTNRQAYALGRYKLENLPNDLQAWSKANAELHQYDSDWEKLEAMLIPIDKAGEIVKDLQNLGAKQQIQVQVPEIQEYIETDENKHQLNQYTGMQEVEISFSAVGNPDDLMLYLHDLEALPYALAVREWQLQTGTNAARGTVRAAPEALDGDDKETVQQTSVLSGKIMVLFEEE